MQSLEKLASELYSLSGAPLAWEKLDDDMLIKYGFMRIAKHVQKRVLEGKIEELERTKECFELSTSRGTPLKIDISLRVAELQRQIEGME